MASLYDETYAYKNLASLGRLKVDISPIVTDLCASINVASGSVYAISFTVNLLFYEVKERSHNGGMG